MSSARAPPPHDENDENSSPSEALAILTSLPSHIAMLDSTGTILFVDDAWRRCARDKGMRGAPDAVGQYRGVPGIAAALREVTRTFAAAAVKLADRRAYRRVCRSPD